MTVSKNRKLPNPDRDEHKAKCVRPDERKDSKDVRDERDELSDIDTDDLEELRE